MRLVERLHPCLEHSRQLDGEREGKMVGEREGWMLGGRDGGMGGWTDRGGIDEGREKGSKG